MRAGVATITEIETVMSLDDMDLWCLYLDAEDEALYLARRGEG